MLLNPVSIRNLLSPIEVVFITAILQIISNQTIILKRLLILKYDFRSGNHEEYQVPVHSSYQLINTQFDPFDFPPKRKPKLKNSFQETKFGH